MAQKSQKGRRKNKPASGAARRQEHRFATSTTYIALPVALIGMLGSLLLGAGVFGLWILDPPLSWASYLVASGGLGLGVALWFGQPSETAVAVGDAGIAVEDGREIIRVPWHAMKSITVGSGSLQVRSSGTTLRFSLGANPKAAAWALSEAAQRMPGVLDVDPSVTDSLPDPQASQGLLQDVVDDQVAGERCANSKTAIRLEEDARLCDRCGQVYHRESVPEECVTCGNPLQGHTLRA